MSEPRFYRGHGLLFSSEIVLPEFMPADPGTPDVTIRIGEQANGAAEKVDFSIGGAYGGFFPTPDGPVLLVGEVANFLVPNGREIFVSPVPGHDPGMVRLYLNGSATGMLFHQRGQFVLHGAALLHGPGVTVFVGHSGAGKSTLAAHLSASGHAVLADDTLALMQDDAGRFVVWPGSCLFKLARDSLQSLPDPGSGHEQVGNRFNKVYYTNPVVAEDRPAPLTRIVQLDRADGPPTLTPLTGLDALQLVAANAYRPEYVALLGHEAEHFRRTARLSGAVETLRLTRPWDLDAMPETIALLERRWIDQSEPAA